MSGGAVRICAGLLLSMLVLTGCAHHLPRMAAGHTIVIAGRYTAGDDAAVASRKVFVEAARLTLAHGFRYFRIAGWQGSQAMPSIQPGARVTIEVYRAGEADPRQPGVWDAMRVGNGDIPGARNR